MNADIDVNVEPLPGYRLIERLGAGGYGEVWRAEAPGGLTKAIKFVFGKHHEKRASHEMRALERVRSVRHPFLLSLERIEVVDGRLLVVTELADGSIKDRFDQCRGQGLHGIPRDELVGYLRDAADALDFMGQAHALQHLDIKPENLLVLAGHVKVADFGLVKDVRQSQVSLVGGMTPLYAAPEVFRGMPSSHSDQYSLGILYQEMLTGTLPFAGSNAAELTLQHLNDEPDMSALSPADRYAVSRALAKDPQHRYATCREFADALSKVVIAEDNSTVGGHIPSSVGATFASAGHFTDALPRENIQTDLFDDDSSTGWNAAPEHRLVELPPPNANLVELPPIDLSVSDAQPVPTLVLGIGGAAGHVLSHVRRMIVNQYGDSAALPAIQMLLLDTDAKALSDATRRERGLAPDETIHLPLRRPQHYREQSQQLLQWLSRRWLYNIPRSLRTEGLRPLGRLALADHVRQTGQRVRRAVMQSLDRDAIHKSSQTLGREFRTQAVRVYVVAAVSGGTGGGMSLDIGYLVRAVLAKIGVALADIVGIAIHATGGDPRHCELARVNAYSWLTEFHHFQQPENGYPGDVSCGLPPHEAGVPAFDHTYLIHLGEQLDELEFEQATLAVAEYLRLNIVTPSGAFFEACRSDSDSNDPSTARQGSNVRSFGVFRQAAGHAELCESFANQVAKQVVMGWRADDKTHASARVTSVGEANATIQGAQELVERLHLTSHGLATDCRALVEMQLNGGTEAFLPAWFEKQNVGGGDVAQFQVVDRLFDDGTIGGAGQTASLMNRPVAVIAEPLERRLRSEIHRWVASRIDDPQERLAGARESAQWIADHFRKVESELDHFSGTVAGKLAELRQAVANDNRMGKAAHYFRLRLDQLALITASYATRVMLSEAKAINDQLTAFGREIEQLLTMVSRAAGADDDVSSVPAEAKSAIGQATPVTAALGAQVDQLATEVEERLQAEFLVEHGGLMQTILRGGRPRAQLNSKLHEFAAQAVGRALEGIQMQGTTDGDGDSTSALRSALAAATPSLVQFGGTRRVLAVSPKCAGGAADSQTLDDSLGVAATTIRGDDNSFILCVETDRISLKHAAVEFVQRRRDRIDFAERVHSRTDILWTPLLSAHALSAPCPWSVDAVPVIPVRQTSSSDLSKTMVM